MSETTQRPVKTVLTPESKIEVVMVEYITGREAEQIAIASQGADKDYTASLGARDLAVNLIIKSIGGETENLSEVMKDMRLGDYSFINDEVTALIDVKKK